jgi:hypothetical protein
MLLLNLISQDGTWDNFNLWKFLKNNHMQSCLKVGGRRSTFAKIYANLTTKFYQKRRQNVRQKQNF